MAKRLTDTNKWRKPFIRSLQAPYKLLFLYILDECDHAGIWHVEMDVASIRIGENMDQMEAIGQLGDKIIQISNGAKWFIPDFIDFQYGELNPENRAHNSVISILKKYNLYNKNKPLTSPLQGCKDKDMDKEKNKDMDKEGESEGEYSFTQFIEDINSMTGKNFRGDTSAKTHFKARVKDGYTREQIQTAIHNCMSDPFHQQNPKYLTPEFITRPDKLEKYVNYQVSESDMDKILRTNRELKLANETSS